MKRRLHHPLWTHIPAFVLWAGFVVWFLVNRAHWDGRVPLRIGSGGEPLTWGSPWVALALVGGIGLLFLGISLLLDELWASQESRKRFNPMSLLDEVVLSLLVTLQWAILRDVAVGVERYRFPVIPFAVVLGCALGAGILLELVRRPAPGVILPERMEATAGFKEQVRARVASGERVVYWDVQNPRYVAWLSLGVPAILWASALFLSRKSLWAAGLNAGIGVLLLLFYGGQRTHVSKDSVTIRYGLAGIRVFRCSLSEIAAIRVRSFSPLAEFGGYGIRVAGGVTAYFLGGRRGVQLDLRERRSALIGSGHPERLATVIETLSGIQVRDEVER